MTLPSSGPLSMNDIAGEFGGSTPHALNEYYAGGGLVPAGTSGTYGAVPSSGTISIQNFYGTSNFVPIYIEEVFNTWVYTGAGGFVTITNGINVSGNGGLVWVKNRNLNDPPEKHIWADTARGGGWTLSSNSTAAQSGPGLNDVTGFTSSGFTIGNNWAVNKNNATYVSWTFRKQPKFFDIVTYTGNGSDQNIAHNLGSVPGFVVIKRTDTAGNWSVWHRSIGNTYLILNTNARAEATGNPARTVTSTTFQIYGNFPDEGANGSSYVMYLFAHDAGGFGLTGTDNVITCGSYVGNGLNAGPIINLGYEPQWLLYKNASNAANWGVIDNMRGWITAPFYTAGDQVLRPNTANPEFADDLFSITPTGFQVVGTDPTNNYNGQTYIYIAIRRGPMKTPTTGTSVFAPIAATPSAGSAATTNFPVDMSMMSDRTGASYVGVTNDRLRGYAASNTTGNYWNLFTPYTWSEATFNPGDPFVYGSDDNTGLKWGTNAAGLSDVLWAFRRAPGFFDVVCYTGTGSTQAVSHNLAAAPELIIWKTRNVSNNWVVGFNFTATTSQVAFLDLTGVAFSRTYPTGEVTTKPTSTTVTMGNNNTWELNSTYVMYLFATLAGISKVGTYTGTAALQTVNCGFTGGARFVLIKRTDSTGAWYVYDSARGISSGNDPYLLMNSTAAEVNGTNYVDTTSVGFQVTAAAPAGLNASGGTYIFLAIA